jgi:hypothetical protein
MHKGFRRTHPQPHKQHTRHTNDPHAHHCSAALRSSCAPVSQRPSGLCPPAAPLAPPCDPSGRRCGGASLRSVAESQAGKGCIGNWRSSRRRHEHGKGWRHGGWRRLPQGGRGAARAAVLCCSAAALARTIAAVPTPPPAAAWACGLGGIGMRGDAVQRSLVAADLQRSLPVGSSR